MMDRDLIRETARATIDAATRAAEQANTRYLGGTVVGAGTPSGSSGILGPGAFVTVKLDGDPSTVNTPVVNVSATALPIGARVIVADSPAGTFVVGSSAQPGGRYLIAGQRLSAAAATFVLTNIPQCFQYLELVATLRSDAAAGQDCGLRVNSLSGGIYTGELIQWSTGGAGLAGSQQSAHTSYDWWCFVPGTNQTAGYFGQATLRILNYNTPAIWPTMIGDRAFWTADAGILNGLALTSCTPGSTAALVNRIDLILGSGNFIAGSQVQLYGIGTAL